MLKLAVNLNNDKTIINSVSAYFHYAAEGGEPARAGYKLENLIKATAGRVTLLSKDFAKCIGDDENGWTFVVCGIEDDSPTLDKINALFSNLSRACGEKVYMLIACKDRVAAGRLAWENENRCIDIQAYPKDGQWKGLLDNAVINLKSLTSLFAVQNRIIVLYGYKDFVKSSCVQVNYICDTSYHGTIKVNGKDIPVISIKQMLSLKNACILIGLQEPGHRNEAEKFLNLHNIEFDYLENYTIKTSTLSIGDMVSKSLVCCWDKWDNKLVYAGAKQQKVIYHIQPFNNSVFGNRVFIGKNFNCSIPQNTYIRIRSSKNKVVIEDNVTIVSAEIIMAGGQGLRIGENTLIGRNAIIRCEISHQLFDAGTKKVLKQKRDIAIGKHVWLGEECYLLSGAKIGNGAVMGARSLASGAIEANSVAVGAPAKVVKRNVIWAKDSSEFEFKTTLYDCIDQDGLKYLD